MALNKYISFSVLILLLAGRRINGQVTEINADTFNIQNFKEEIYIQTDRDIYISGEQVWLKIYKINRLSSAPADESKVIYFELLDNSGNIDRQLKISVNGFSGSAGFRLSDTLSSGNYLIRAYSNWMQNYSEDLFFYKYITVINPFKHLEKLVNKTSFQYPDTVIFFPEGGKFISGIRSKTGVRGIGTNGIPVKLQGDIINNKDEKICEIRTDSSGFGLFSLTPSKGEQLFLQYRISGGALRKQLLPPVSDGGISLSVESADNNPSFRIRIRNNQNNSINKATLIITSGGLVTFFKEVNPDRDSLVSVSRSGLPAGGAHIVLINGSGSQLAERWIYNNNDRIFHLSIKLPKQDFRARERVEAGISATDKSGVPVFADLSVSVVKTALTEKGRINIVNRYEYSAAPGGWFSDLNSDEMNDHLLNYWNNNDQFDNLFKQTPFKHDHLPELGGQLITGVVKNKLTHDPLKNTDISLAFVGKTAHCQFTRTGENGGFNFVVNKPGLSEIVIQPLLPVSSGYYVEFNQPFCTTFNGNRPPFFSLDSTRADEINHAIINMQVSNIYEPFIQQKTDPGATARVYDFFGEPDKEINLADYIELTTVREVIKEIVPDLLVNKKNKEYGFKLVSNLPSASFENGPLVLVDGVPFYNIGKLLNANSKDLERIDLLISQYFYTDYIFDGIVSFITKKGNLSAVEFDNSIFRQVFEGCQLPQKFYSPDYSNKTISENHIPDFRNTLYWKPDLRSDKEGKASVSFFTSDEPGEYTIIVEGITSDGKSGICRIPFIVK